MRQYLLIMSTALLLSSCNTMMKGSTQNGKYVSSNREFSVDTPSLPGLAISDGSSSILQYVDFTPLNGYWVLGDSYSIEWFKMTPQMKSKSIEMINEIPEQMKSNVKLKGGNLQIVSCKELTLRGSFAKQCIGSGVSMSVPMKIVGTSMVIQNHLVSVYVRLPSKKGKEVPWKNYNHLINSIHIRET